MTETNRCLWCHGGQGELREIVLEVGDRLAGAWRQRRVLVHPEHEGELRDHQRLLRGFGRTFLVGVAVLLGLMLLIEVPLVWWSARWGLAGIGLSVAALGALLVALPFATPETVRLWGVRGSVLAVRGAGSVLATLGSALLAFALLALG